MATGISLPLPVLNCPYCGNPARYQRTEDDRHIYECRTDGRLCLHPDGRFLKHDLVH